MLLYGKRSVKERIKTNPKSIHRIFLQEDIAQSEIVELARRKNIYIRNLQRRRFLKLTRGAQSQGVIAEVDRFRYHDYQELFEEDINKNISLIFLDRITDPQNLGAILRSCACWGGFCIVLPRHKSVDINETVLKVACGAENYIPVCLVTNLSQAISEAKGHGYCIAAAVTKQGKNISGIKLDFPLGLLFGSEGEGIRPGLMRHVDYKLTLPMQGADLSLNVAMAVGIFGYEVMRQRQG